MPMSAKLRDMWSTAKYDVTFRRALEKAEKADGDAGFKFPGTAPTNTEKMVIVAVYWGYLIGTGAQDAAHLYCSTCGHGRDDHRHGCPDA